MNKKGWIILKKRAKLPFLIACIFALKLFGLYKVIPKG